MAQPSNRPVQVQAAVQYSPVPTNAAPVKVTATPVAPSAPSHPVEVHYQGSIKDASVEIRNGFVRKVYSLLTVQLLLTVAIAAPFQMLPLQTVGQLRWIYYVATAVMLSTMCGLICCPRMLREYPTNYVFLFTLTSAMGVLVGFASAQFTWQSVLLAAGITAVIFGSLTVYACFTTQDFTGLGPYLYGALSTLCIFSFALLILAMCGVQIRALTIVYDLCGVLLFVFYIIYDTQMIMGNHKQEFGIDDYVFAALNLYLDIINMFLYILDLIGDRRS